ncbi:MAG TPA: hypothetical protein VMN60_10460 [Longimicrobiales bacterium]|nr:hypothetical protein [Longimicrobiales bacterium]
MAARVHIVVSEAEKEGYRRHAARAGKTLSEWLRAAAREKVEAAEAQGGLPDGAALAEFFAACDERESGREPDWESHRAVIDASRAAGAAPP